MTEEKTSKPLCPQCQKPTVHQYRPFCSKRCANLDLGKWFNEEYVLPGSSPLEGIDPGDAEGQG